MTPAELQREIDAMQDKTDVDKLRQTYKDVLKDKKDGKAPYPLKQIPLRS